ncbi:MAG: hypothetical protein AAB252_04245 [Pseudomonadota bacterium]
MNLMNLFEGLVSHPGVEHPETVAGESPYETEAMVCVGDVYSLLLAPVADREVAAATLAPAAIRRRDLVSPFLR